VVMGFTFFAPMGRVDEPPHPGPLPPGERAGKVLGGPFCGSPREPQERWCLCVRMAGWSAGVGAGLAPRLWADSQPPYGVFGSLFAGSAT